MSLDHIAFAKQWIQKANEDILVIDSLVDTGIEFYYSSITFHAHQAIEKYLKSFLVYHKTHFPRTHDLEFLLSICKPIHESLFKDLDFGLLTDYGVSVRYPDDLITPEKAEVLLFIELARDTQRRILSYIDD